MKTKAKEKVKIDVGISKAYVEMSQNILWVMDENNDNVHCSMTISELLYAMRDVGVITNGEMQKIINRRLRQIDREFNSANLRGLPSKEAYNG